MPDRTPPPPRPFLPLLEASLREAPVVWREGYPYFIHPLSDGVPFIEPALLKEAVEGMVAVADLDCDCIVTPEAMGLPLATGLSLRTGLPLNVLRKRSYGLEGELNLPYETGYSQGNLYLNSLEGGERVLLVDDVVSTGGTLRAVVAGLRELGVEIGDVVILFEKGDRKALERELGQTIKTLLKVEVTAQGRLRIPDQPGQVTPGQVDVEGDVQSNGHGP